MSECKHVDTDIDGTCMKCGLTEECRTIAALRAEVRDLKARLHAVRGPQPMLIADEAEAWERILRITDLRVKKWRGP